MKRRIRLFAGARQIVGQDLVELEMGEPATVADLRRALLAAYPAMEPLLRHTRFAVDNSYVSEATGLAPHAEIACIPPVSGG